MTPHRLKAFTLFASVALTAVGCKESTPPEAQQQAEAPADPSPEAKKHAEEREKPNSPQLASTPSELLQPGAVKRLQEALASAGFMEKQDDAKDLDRATSAALQKFQQSQKLAATGFPDEKTIRALGLSEKDILRTTFPVEEQQSTAGRRGEARR